MNNFGTLNMSVIKFQKKEGTTEWDESFSKNIVKRKEEEACTSVNEKL